MDRSSRRPFVQMPEIFHACVRQRSTPPPPLGLFACFRNLRRNASDAAALSLPVIFGTNGQEEIRRPDNERVHLARRDAPSRGPGVTEVSLRSPGDNRYIEEVPYPQWSLADTEDLLARGNAADRGV